MRILSLAVINHQAAIAMEALVQRHALLAHKLQQQITPHLPQIAGDDEVVVRGLSMGIRQQGQQSVGAMAAPMLLASFTPRSTTRPMHTRVTHACGGTGGWRVSSTAPAPVTVHCAVGGRWEPNSRG